MAANGISTMQFKRDRQNAMLEQERLKRVAQGTRRSVLDPTQLPTRYGVGSNDAGDYVNNPNYNGLVAGRPWTY